MKKSPVVKTYWQEISDGAFVCWILKVHNDTVVLWCDRRGKSFEESVDTLSENYVQVYNAKGDQFFPEYVKLGGTALTHRSKGLYYRHAGCWEVRAGWRDGKLVCITKKGPAAHLRGKELVKCSNKEWAKDNKGYI